ncbi:MAG TPA: hypothetical protein EYP10_02220 [Armatimonadetes bacterium]|nr:hypothetical protein [Armatimonadota bacterium]
MHLNEAQAHFLKMGIRLNAVAMHSASAHLTSLISSDMERTDAMSVIMFGSVFYVLNRMVGVQVHPNW